MSCRGKFRYVVVSFRGKNATSIVVGVQDLGEVEKKVMGNLVKCINDQKLKSKLDFAL